MEIEKNDSALKSFEGQSLRPKRQQKSSSEREPRITEIKANFSNEVVIKEVRLSLDASRVEFFGRPVSILVLRDAVIVPMEVEIVNYYRRASKRKVLNAFFFRDEHPPASIQWALARYDHFYALDTNTWTFDGVGQVSVCVVVQGRTGPVSADYSAGSYDLAYSSVFDGADGNPEMRAVRELVEGVRERIPIATSRPIGLIVDTELGRLKRINYREDPVADDFFLPVGFEMVHATDASGTTEFLTNQMIRACDVEATRLLRKIQSDQNLVRVS